MPQPFKGITVYQPDCLRRRPELAVEIANIASNWSQVEDRLLRLYALLMGAYAAKLPLPPHGGFQWPAQFHPLAYQIFDTIGTLNSRLDLLGSLLEAKGIAAEVLFYKETLRQRIRKTAGSRNLVVHGLWAIGFRDKKPKGGPREVLDGIILKPISGSAMLYKLSDFLNISSLIVSLRGEIEEFEAPIYERLQQEQNKLK